MGYVVPTLTTEGFSRDINLNMVKLFEYFITSDYSQTNMFYGHIASLPYIIKEAGNDLDQLQDMAKEALSSLYNRYYDNVTVDVKITSKEINNKKHANIINFNVTVIVNNNIYELNKSMQIINNNLNTLDSKLDFILQND